MALVAEPAAIEGVESWTIETLGHRGPVYDVAYSPDGGLVATACADGVVRLWDVQSHTVVGMLVAYDGRVRCLAWAPDSSALASAGEDWTIRLWDVKSGLTLRALRGHLGEVRSVAFSPDGLRLASAAEDKTVRLWDVTTTKPPVVLRGHEAEVTCVAFSPDGRLVASGSLDKKVKVWDAESGGLKDSFTGHAAPVYAVAFSPSGPLLASAGASSQSADAICLWNVADGGLARKLEGHAGGDTCLAFSPDGQLLAAGGATSDPSVRIWDAGGGEVLHTLKKPSGDQAAWSVAFSPDGQALAAGDGAGVVQFWEALSGRKLQALPVLAARVRCVGFAPDEITLAAGYDDGTMRLFLTDSGEPAGRFPPAAAVVRRMVFSPDARKLATSYAAGGLVDLWQVATGERLAQVRGTRNVIEYLVWSADSKTIAAGNGTGKLWDAVSGQPVRDLPSHGSAMAWSPDGATLAIAVGGDVRLFAGGLGRPTRNLFSSRESVCSLAWSPDGKTLACGNEDNRVYLWNVEQPTPRPTIYKGHKAAPVTLSWLEGGDTLVTGSPSEICVWGTASGKLLRTIAADGTAVSPSGRLFATREESTVRLRSLEDGRLVRSLVSLSAGAYVAVGPRGHYRASPETEAELVYVVQTGAGQQMLSPEQFAEEHGWKNDPELVQSWSD